MCRSKAGALVTEWIYTTGQLLQAFTLLIIISIAYQYIVCSVMCVCQVSTLLTWSQYILISICIYAQSHSLLHKCWLFFLYSSSLCFSIQGENWTFWLLVSHCLMFNQNNNVNNNRLCLIVSFIFLSIDAYSSLPFLCCLFSAAYSTLFTFAE